MGQPDAGHAASPPGEYIARVGKRGELKHLSNPWNRKQ